MCCTNDIPAGAAETTDVAGKMAANGEYTPSKIPDDQTDRALAIIRFFHGNQTPGTQDLPIEVGIAVAGVWSAESGIKTTAYNKAEHNNGYAFKNKHAPNADTFKYKGKTYYKDQANMMKFGYGKGVAQWSWSRVFKFRDWYNSPSGFKTSGISQIDEDGAKITGTSVTTQTAFAWKEMQERTGEFMKVINEVNGNPASTKEQFQENVIKVVDAVLRGYENGSAAKMASTKQIDKYTWDGGYSGAMKKRVSRAFGVAEAVKEIFPNELSFL